MKIGVFCMSASHLPMAARLLESVRSVMPHAEVHHLTDEHCPTLTGVDSTRVFYGAMPMAVRRMMHHAACEGEWLFVDSDVIIQRDVSDVFEAPFDIALTDREGTITTEARYAVAMPHNIGVVFSRSQDFWSTVAHHLKTLMPKLQEWEGDQLVINAMVKEGGHGFNIKTLPGLIYNYPPRSADDPRTKDAAIVHYKGNRKQWISQNSQEKVVS